MSKFLAIMLSITIFVSGTMNAQTVAPMNENQPNLREAVSKETGKLKSESAELDVKAMEKSQRQTPKKKFWNKNTVIITGIVVALVGLAVVLMLTTKRCVRRSPSGCNFTEDVNCECLEYAE